MQRRKRSVDHAHLDSSQHWLQNMAIEKGDEAEMETSPPSPFAIPLAALVSLAAGESSLSATSNGSASEAIDIESPPIDRLLKHLGSCPLTGIDSSTIADRKSAYGVNSIEKQKKQSYLFLAWEASKDFVLIALFVMAIVSLVTEIIGKNTGDSHSDTPVWIESFAILFSCFIIINVTASIDYVKQYAFERLTQICDENNKKTVIRDGKQEMITDGAIVVGDVVLFDSHTSPSIPADTILLSGESIKVDESSLTGESRLIPKALNDLILGGTSVSEGAGKLLVIAVGTNTTAGKINEAVYSDSAEKEDSPLTAKLEKLAKLIGWFGLSAAILAFVVMLIIGQAVKDEDRKEIITYFVTAVTVLAVAVPEGLPLAVTLSLAFSSNKMMKEQNLVKQLAACETMGCATTICTDKTGTLTTNKMTARTLFVFPKMFKPRVTESLAEIVQGERESVDKNVLSMIKEAISVNTMDVSTPTTGNPTESALLELVNSLNSDFVALRRSSMRDLPSAKLFAFSSDRKMMSWLVQRPGGGDEWVIFVKGAPEKILECCSSVMTSNSTIEPLTTITTTKIASALSSNSTDCMRSLALAFREFSSALPDWRAFDPGTDNFKAETNLTFLSLIGIEDPLRPEVFGAIEKCYNAGIDVRMVTGDNESTAKSIALRAGILKEEQKDLPGFVMNGDDFRLSVHNSDGEFSQECFDSIWPKLRVLARSSPQDKLTLANGLNRSLLYSDDVATSKLKSEYSISIFPDRQVVAMTGDGTNDAQALKRADIGFAMNTGTQIAKDAADIILLDDNFASIITAAKWGRNIYASIQKFLQFQLTVNFAAVTVALVGSFAYQQSPLAAIQLLWVNLIMDSLASLALATEPPTDDLLNKPPVNRSKSMITTRMWRNILGHAALQIIVVLTILFKGYEWFDVEQGNRIEKDDKETDYYGVPSTHYTIIFNSFVLLQLFNEINCRMLNGERNVFSNIHNNVYFCGIWIVTAALQVVIVEKGGVAMNCVEGGLDASQWGLCVLIGFASLPFQQLLNFLPHPNVEDSP